MFKGIFKRCRNLREFTVVVPLPLLKRLKRCPMGLTIVFAGSTAIVTGRRSRKEVTIECGFAYLPHLLYLIELGHFRRFTMLIMTYTGTPDEPSMFKLLPVIPLACRDLQKLVLVASITCERRQEFVNFMLKASEDVQIIAPMHLLGRSPNIPNDRRGRQRIIFVRSPATPQVSELHDP